MHIIKRAKLVEFWEKKENSGSESFLDAWYRTMKKGTFDNIAQIREVYRHADIVGECIIFNVGTNKYRVVTKNYFTEQTLLIRFVMTHFVMTHKEYDKDTWKNDCGC
ncbi:MAG: type II toxin-antitoxin system HigB family toxin [Pyrinomonadaceae bacterium]